MKKKKTGAVNSSKKRYDGKQFQSSLELYCYKKLKEADLKFEYEGETFKIFPAFQYPGRYGKKAAKAFSIKQGATIRAVTYTPDFVSHEHKFVIETKGFVPSQHSFPLRFKMFLLYLIEYKMGDYSIYIPGNQKQVDDVIRDIVEKKGKI